MQFLAWCWTCFKQTIRSQSWQPDRQREEKRARLRSKFCFGRVARSFVFMHACIQYIHVSVVMHAYMSTYTQTHMHACIIYYCDVYFLLPVLPILLLYSIIILQCSKQIHWVGSIDLYASCNDLQARRTTSEMDSRILYMELACMHAMMLPMPRDRSSTQSIRSVHVTICRPS